MKRFDRYSKEEDEIKTSTEPIDENDYFDKTKFETYTKSENLFDKSIKQHQWVDFFWSWVLFGLLKIIIPS